MARFLIQQLSGIETVALDCFVTPDFYEMIMDGETPEEEVVGGLLQQFYGDYDPNTFLNGGNRKVEVLVDIVNKLVSFCRIFLHQNEQMGSNLKSE